VEPFLSSRWPALLGLVLFAAFMLAGNGITLLSDDPDAFFAKFLFDYDSSIFPYPFTIQNLMWLVFFVGLADLYVADRRSRAHSRQLNLGLLPEDQVTMLNVEDLGSIYKNVDATDVKKEFFLQRLLSRCILQFQVSQSIDQTNSLLTSSIELLHHEIDLAYTMNRYISWLIPTLGFIGTVIGIAFALADIGSVQNVDELQDPQKLVGAIQNLGVAFYTTLLALLQSAMLVFLNHVVQSREERSLNNAGQYCIDNLINRLYC